MSVAEIGMHAPPPLQAFPLDEYEMPAWCAMFLTDKQFADVNARLRWALLLDKAPLPPTAHLLALRLHLYMAGGRNGARAWPTVTTLAKILGLQRPTVRSGLAHLASNCWIKETENAATGRREWLLCWPGRSSVMAAPESLAGRCGAATKKGDGHPCQRPAGHNNHCARHREGLATPGQPLTTPGQPLTTPGQPLTLGRSTTDHEFVTEAVTQVVDVIRTAAPLPRRSGGTA